MAKIAGRHFTYQFVCDLRQGTGYTPAELKAITDGDLPTTTTSGRAPDEQLQQESESPAKPSALNLSYSMLSEVLSGATE